MCVLTLPTCVEREEEFVPLGARMRENCNIHMLASASLSAGLRFPTYVPELVYIFISSHFSLLLSPIQLGTGPGACAGKSLTPLSYLTKENNTSVLIHE